MKREWDLNEVSDGRLYLEHDMAKVGCRECEGCHDCCCDMGESVVLDPYDIYELCRNLRCDFETLLQENKLSLGVVDGVILPHLNMEENGACRFLNEMGRCAIHGFRPGICRLFPLGRVYADHDYRYFIQIHECSKKERTKVKISKWLGVPNGRQYHAFVNEWHYFLKKIQDQAAALQEAGQLKTVGMFILQEFFLKSYNGDADFYEQFADRMQQAKMLPILK